MISLKVTSVWIQAVALHQQVSWRLILAKDGPDSIAERDLRTPAVGSGSPGRGPLPVRAAQQIAVMSPT